MTRFYQHKQPTLSQQLHAHLERLEWERAYAVDDDGIDDAARVALHYYQQAIGAKA